MIIFDTETTGLPNDKCLSDLSKQPKIIEFGALKVDKDLKVIDEISFLVNPNEKLDKVITKITGLTDDDLKDEPPFIEYYGVLYEFFLGTKNMVAHNMSFDFKLMLFELQRVGKEYHFSWPQQHLCTLEIARGLDLGLENNKLETLWKAAKGEEPKQTHRALGDCYMLLDVIKWMRKEYGVI